MPVTYYTEDEFKQATAFVAEDRRIATTESTQKLQAELTELLRRVHRLHDLMRRDGANAQHIAACAYILEKSGEIK